MAMNPRLLRPIARRSGDPDVAAYIAAVEQADGQPLEQGVKDAYRNFIVGCKQDGIWTAIKASCILCGARTIGGALTPLAGPQATNNNFVSGDYSRASGLVGNYTTKYIDTGATHGVHCPAANAHASTFITQSPTFFFDEVTEQSAGIEQFIIGCGAATGSTRILLQVFSSSASYAVQRATAGLTTRQPPAGFLGFFGCARGNTTQQRALFGTASSPTTVSATAGAPAGGNFFVFASSNGGAADLLSDARVAFYSIGTDIDLAALRGRVSALVATIGAAI